MKIRYHWQDWQRDWEAVLEQSLRVPKESENNELRDYFLGHYPNPEEARWRCERILRALRYLEANSPSFEQGGWVIASSKGGTVTRYMTTALYRFFGVVDDVQVLVWPDPQLFIDAAEEHERINP